MASVVSTLKRSQNNVLEAKAVVDFAQKVFRRGSENHCNEVQFRLLPTGKLEVTFFKAGEDGSSEKSSQMVIDCSPEQWRALNSYFWYRSYHWPDLHDPLWCEPSTGAPRRLFVAPEDQSSLLCEVEFLDDPGDGTLQFWIRNMQWSTQEPHFLFEYFSDQNQYFLKDSCECSSGLIIANRSGDSLVVDGCAFILARRPDAIAYLNPTSAEVLKKAIQLSRDRLVVLGVEANDPIEAMFAIVSPLKGELEEVRKFFKLLLMSCVEFRARRTCQNCASDTVLSEPLLERLPEILRPQKGTTQKQGAGCKGCNNSGFLGTVGFESIIQVNDRVRKLLLEGGSPGQITEIAYRFGVRSLLEDALEKATQGLTTYDELLSTVTKISPAFVGALSCRIFAEDESPFDNNVKKKLDSLDEDFFLVEDEETEDTLSLSEPEISPASSSTASEQDSEPARLLLIEDDADQRSILEFVFQGEGYEVLCAQNGKEALNVLGDNSTDVVVCDLMMPVMNGEEFVKQVRSMEQYRHLPVMMLTAIDSDQAELNLLTAGADDYCSKGTNKEVILKRIERLLSRTRNPLQHLLER